MSMRSNQTLSLLAAGAAVGVVAGMLMAPYSGHESRSVVKRNIARMIRLRSVEESHHRLSPQRHAKPIHDSQRTISPQLIPNTAVGGLNSNSPKNEPVYQLGRFYLFEAPGPVVTRRPVPMTDKSPVS